jgi:hypothetical protein
MLVLTGCGLFHDDGDDYEARLAAWQREDYPLYKWTVVWSEPVFGPFPMEVLVRDGVPVRAYSNNEKLKIEEGQVEGRPATIDALIEWLARYAPDAVSADIEWSPTGYPSRIELDHSDVIDDEVTVSVEGFIPMDPMP